MVLGMFVGGGNFVVECLGFEPKLAFERGGGGELQTVPCLLLISWNSTCTLGISGKTSAQVVEKN